MRTIVGNLLTDFLQWFNVTDKFRAHRMVHISLEFRA